MKEFLPPITRVTLSDEAPEAFLYSIRASTIFNSPETHDEPLPSDVDIETAQANTLDANAIPEYLDVDTKSNRPENEENSYLVSISHFGTFWFPAQVQYTQTWLPSSSNSLTVP